MDKDIFKRFPSLSGKLPPIGEDFDERLKESIIEARKKLFPMRVLSVDVLEDKTLIRVMNGLLVFEVNQKKKLVVVHMAGKKGIADILNGAIPLLDSYRSEDSTYMSSARLFIRKTDVYVGELHKQIKIFICSSIYGAPIRFPHFFDGPWQKVLSFSGSLKDDIKIKGASKEDRIHISNELDAEKDRQKKEIRKHDAKLFNTYLGKTKNGKWVNPENISRYVGKYIWKSLDKEVIKIALCSRNRCATLFDYNICWQNKEELKKINKHSPALIPIFVQSMTAHIKENDNIGEGDIEGLISFYKEANDSGNFYVENPVQRVQGILNLLSDKDMSKSAWKYLVKSPAYLIRKILTHTLFYKAAIQDSPFLSAHGVFTETEDIDTHYCPSIHNGKLLNFNDIIEFLNDVRVMGKQTAMNDILNFFKIRKTTPTIISCVRKSFVESRRRPAKGFALDRFPMILDWLYCSKETYRSLEEPNPFSVDDFGIVTLDKNQKKLNWEWLMKCQERYHQDALRVKFIKEENKTWVSLIKETKSNGFIFTPLVESKHLHEEGRVMHQCVGGYSSKCESGHTRIFHVSLNKKDVATMEIEISMDRNMYNDDYNIICKLGQLYGPCNQKVDNKVFIASDKIVNMYQKAVRDVCLENACPTT